MPFDTKRSIDEDILPDGTVIPGLINLININIFIHLIPKNIQKNITINQNQNQNQNLLPPKNKTIKKNK